MDRQVNREIQASILTKLFSQFFPRTALHNVPCVGMRRANHSFNRNKNGRRQAGAFSVEETEGPKDNN